MLKLTMVTLLVASALAAQSKGPTKPFTPPEDYYTEGPALAKDEGCAKDYAKALSLSGLDQRKMLAELISYKCLEVTPSYVVYRALILESKTIDVGSQHFPMVHVRLASNLRALPVGPAVVNEGWMLRSALVTKSQVEALIKRRQTEKK